MSHESDAPADVCIRAVHAADDVRRVAALASAIWREYYVPLIGAAQVDYMLEKFQSAEAMLGQIERGDEYFIICCADQPSGYLAVRSNAADQSVFISKLYLQRELRGAGTGRRALQFIEQLALERGLKLLWLTVNKHNSARKAYEKWGFKITESIRIDIGAGFVMDDFRMEKRLGAGAP